MPIFSQLLDFVLHIDSHLGELILRYGAFSYGILFAILFSETGFVFTPFLPGDSLIFAAGAFAALGSFDLILLILILWIAAFLGDTVNYWIGFFFGEKLVSHPKIPINRGHIDKTQAFYDKHGGKTIFLARFVPVIRTFAPFVAGVGKMDYKKFIFFNVTGGFVWVITFALLGYFFGNLPQVKDNFTLVIFVIVIISVAPIIIELLRKKLTASHVLKKD